MSLFCGCTQLTITPTRFAGLGFTQVVRASWRMVDLSTDAVIGPQYKTKTELLADLPRFAAERGFV